MHQMSSTLPFEICGLIIDYLYDDKAALRKCSLVCKSWLRSARFHVFQTLELVSYDIEDALDFICAEGCTIPKYVRHLEITGEENNQAEELFNSALLRLPPLIDLENLALHSLPWATLDDGAKMRLSSMLSRTTSLGLYAAKFDSLDEAVQIIASAPLLKKLILVGSTFAQNTISDTAPTAPNIKSLEVDRGEHLSPFLAWLRSSHTVPCVDSLAIGWSHTADLPPICAYIEDIGASLKDLSLEPNFIDNSPNADFAEQLNLDNNLCLRSTHFGPLNLQPSSSGRQSISWTIQIISKIVSKSFEKITLVFFLTSPNDMPIDSLLTICGILTDESNIFQGQSVKLRIELRGTELRVEHKDTIKTTLSDVLAALHTQGRLEFEQ